MDPTATIAAPLVVAASEVVARLVKRLPWLKGKPKKLRAVVIRTAAVGSGLAVRFACVWGFGKLGLGPGFDQATALTLAQLCVEGLLEACAPLGLYKLAKK